VFCVCHSLKEEINSCNLNSGFPHTGAKRQIIRRNILVEKFWFNNVEIWVLSRENECNKHSFDLSPIFVWIFRFVETLDHWFITVYTLNQSYLYQYSAITWTAKSFDLSTIFTVMFQLSQWDFTCRLCMWWIGESFRRTSCMKRVKPTRCYTMVYWTLRFAQHVSGIIMPIITSLRLYRWPHAGAICIVASSWWWA
jgi:hypothetical protein